MTAAEGVEYFAGGALAPLGNVFHALPESLVYICPSGGVEQALVCLGVLDDGLGLASHGKDQGPLALSKLSDELTGIASESRQRLDIFGDVEHGERLFQAIYGT
jgi:hypothetical protein